MNKLVSIVFILCFTPFLGVSQKGDMSFQVGGSYHSFSMNDLNTFMSKDRDGFYETPKGSINSGYGVHSRLALTLHKSIDIGISGGFLNASSLQDGAILTPNPNLPTGFDTLGVQYGYRTPAFLFGVSSRVYLDELVNLASKLDGNDQLKIGIDVDAGMGWSYINRSEKLINRDGSIASFTDNFEYRSTDIFGRISLNIMYDLLQSNIMSALGLHVGYQFYKTGLVSDQTGQSVFRTNESITLNYSGLFFGVHLSLGK